MSSAQCSYPGHVRRIALSLRSGCAHATNYCTPYGGSQWLFYEMMLSSGLRGIETHSVCNSERRFRVALPLGHRGATAEQAYCEAVAFLVQRIDQFSAQRAVTQALETLG